ncbi:hypothetical protein BGW38_009399 [Lunasporangiospora selenospora]|uniref:ABC-type multidrug transport system, ATPase and permease component n=1 Tax=Lunasporangiospora selenospora TaxID=979761 RepID=A0A9P6G2W3_9FUNG|nr:hypothetical protein BGW38_009399 [Lunasporangiospora selenospora]
MDFNIGQLLFPQGPVSQDRYDLTPCFEFSALYGALSALVALLLCSRLYSFWRHGKRHGLGRTAMIYWPTQISMTLASIVIASQALEFYLQESHLSVAVLGCLGMAITWVTAIFVNHFEHEYEIRSSTVIFSFFVTSIASTAIILHTLFDLRSLTGAPRLLAFMVLLIVGLVVEAWPRGWTKVQQSCNVSNYDKANIASRLTFFFFQSTVNVALRRSITFEDIANLLPEKLKTGRLHHELSSRWNARIMKRQRSSATVNKKNSFSPRQSNLTNPPSLFWTVMLTHLSGLVPIIFIRIVYIFLSYGMPFLLSVMLTYLEESDQRPRSYGIMLAFSMFLCSIVATMLYTYNRFQMFQLGVGTRAALISMVYRKALRLSPGSRQRSTTGEITNHMSVDADQWGDAMLVLTSWISVPLEITVALIMLYQFLGWTMIAGVAGLLLVLPLQAWQARAFEIRQSEKLAAMDRRIRLTSEVLAGIKVVKIYGWERAFRERILSLRKQELVALKKLGFLQAYISIVYFSFNLIISLLAFGAYTLWGGPDGTPGTLTPQKVFVSMTLFTMLRIPLSNLSEATTSTISIVVSTARIQEFLLREEVNDDDYVRSNSLPRSQQDPVVLVKEGSFTWDDRYAEEYAAEGEATSPQHEDHQGLLTEQCSRSPNSGLSTGPTLSSINLSVAREDLIAVVGRVGQGKSSLLSAIIGEMYKLEGKVQMSGRVAYVPQQAWIVNATLRDNILFGNDLDQERYNRVLFTCGLEPDLAMLPAGDQTEIGERGINLSGGQKQRVSLARAAYADADIYLLDDPLSAVDAHVSHHLWSNLIGPTGLLRDKARILVTHGLQHLRDVDHIVVLKDGAIVEQGSFAELIRSKQTFYQLIKEHSHRHSERPKDGMTRRTSSASYVTSMLRNDGTARSGGTKFNQAISVKDDTTKADTAESSASLQADGDGAVGDLSFEYDSTDTVSVTGGDADPESQETTPREEGKGDKGKLIEIEKLKEGNVDVETALRYARAAIGSSKESDIPEDQSGDINLSNTHQDLERAIPGTQSQDISLGLFLGVYSLITLLYVIIYFVVNWLGLAVARIRASEALHRDLLTKILRLPMSFFDTTPLGRILNRFSSDILVVDERLPNKAMDTTFFLVSVTSTLIMILYATPAFFFVLPFTLQAYWVIQYCFRRVNQSIVRIYSVSKSPVYQHFTETLSGVSTIRAMSVQAQFIKANTEWVDRMANAFLAFMISKRWVEIQLRFLSTTILFTASLLINNLVSMERVVEYMDLDTEAPEHTSVKLPEAWPNRGQVRFCNYSTRYREGLDLVLKNISIDVQPGQKIGIVGRTGAGKSSLTLALFRIIEAANTRGRSSPNGSVVQMESESQGYQTAQTRLVDFEEPQDDVSTCGGSQGRGSDFVQSRIEIDGIDISTIGLEELRQNLSIIPQDPTLFAGTVRDNLDPFQQAQDADLWEALERSHLKSYIISLPGGLHAEVIQNGENFSVGQRSLLCLARAILRRNKILIMDEATAAVDVETDKLVQQTIRSEFHDRTILTIAHRIKTVMDSDKILVLDHGSVVEYDAPSVLLKRGETSLFYQLAKQAGEI